MEYVILVLVSFLASLLTFYSGFGLGTILLPVFSFLVPLELAIAMTAIVHFLNTIFKFILTFRQIHWKTFFRFGFVSFVFAILGAWVLKSLVIQDWNVNFNLISYEIHTTILKIVIGTLLILFTLLEYFDLVKIKSAGMWGIFLGGFLSGFFGGLSGHQGALRSAFLRSLKFSKEQFIATGIACALLVDMGRLMVYLNLGIESWSSMDFNLICLSIIAAWSGAWIGNRYLNKITQNQLQFIVCIGLVVFGALLILGKV